ncbi:MAG: HAD family hydrolase [Lachnospiraceae bacterium]|nr:HAD family hydrolase [Lachnospiraceae bacterium]
MSETKKILFTDVDDTLLNRRKEISAENRAAIEAAVSAGHRVVICTGRPLCSTKALIQSLGLTSPGCFVICYNGGLIYDCHKNQVLYRRTLTAEQLDFVFSVADEADIHVQTYDADAMLSRTDSPEARFYGESTHCPYRVEPGIPDVLSDGSEKALLISFDRHDLLDQCRQKLSARPDSGMTFFYSSDHFLEAVPEGVSKGSAITWFCEHFGIPMENTVSAGDAENDLPMLRTAHIGCAMANATEPCKETADYITENDCDHSGLAEIIQKFILQ